MGMAPYALKLGFPYCGEKYRTVFGFTDFNCSSFVNQKRHFLVPRRVVKPSTIIISTGHGASHGPGVWSTRRSVQEKWKLRRVRKRKKLQHQSLVTICSRTIYLGLWLSKMPFPIKAVVTIVTIGTLAPPCMQPWKRGGCNMFTAVWQCSCSRPNGHDCYNRKWQLLTANCCSHRCTMVNTRDAPKRVFSLRPNRTESGS